MSIDYRKLGKKLKTIRKDKKISQQQLAEKIGLSNNYISNIETDRSIPSLETLVKICNVLETTPDYVLTGSLYKSKEYLKDDIAKLLEQCDENDMKMVINFIKALIEEK